MSILEFRAMTRYPRESISGLIRELGGLDGDLTFDEAVDQVASQKFKGPETRPIKCGRSSCGNDIDPPS